MVKISNQNFITNKFSKSNTKKIIQALSLVNERLSAQELLKQIPQPYSKQYCWAIGGSPAYHIQYQVDSVAILKINNYALIVWKPKYIEYPNMVQFPDLQQKKLKNLSLEVDKKVTKITDSRLQQLIQYMEKFYGTFFHNDQQFDTNLVTFAKNFVSKRTAVSYWHSLYDDTNKLALLGEQQLDCAIKIRVTGVKQGYDKTLLLFSKKGQKQGILNSLFKKWVQTISFFAMMLIFIAMVGCDEGVTEGVCQYRNEAMVGGAGLMMSLFGLKLAKRAKNKAGKKDKIKSQ